MGKREKFALCVGLPLVSLSLVCIVANALLLVPDGKTWSTDQLSLQVLLMPGFIGGGLMVLCKGIAVVRAGGKDYWGADCCEHPCWEPCSKTSQVFGILGSIYCFVVSIAGLDFGPKCLIHGRWDYHFRKSSGAYLNYHDRWNLCEEPLKVVPWNMTLFSLLVVASGLEILLCFCSIDLGAQNTEASQTTA